MRNPEDAYKSKPDVEMPLFERICANCQRPEGEHAHIGDSCPTFTGPRLYDAVKKFTPVAHARRSDPDTSKLAAASVKNLGRTRDAILRILRALGPCTDEQIQAAYSRGYGNPILASPSGLRSRRSELVRMGLVVDSGRVGKTASGRQTIIWKVAK